MELPNTVSSGEAGLGLATQPFFSVLFQEQFEVTKPEGLLEIREEQE